MSAQYGFSFDAKKCLQCHGCQAACKTWRGVELWVTWRRVENIWEGSYPNVKCSSLSVACMHCADPPCVEACPEDAIEKRADGVVVVDRDKCTGCLTCEEECPYGVPQFGTDGKMQKCDMCKDEIDHDSDSPPCVATCPTEALTFGKMSKKEKIAGEKSMKRAMGM